MATTTKYQRGLLRALETGWEIYYRPEKACFYGVPPATGKKMRKQKPVVVEGLTMRIQRKLQAKGLITVGRDGRWRLAA